LKQPNYTKSKISLSVYIVEYPINKNNIFKYVTDTPRSHCGLLSPFASQAYGGGTGGSFTGAMSGSYIISLNIGDTLQLLVSAFVGDVTASSPSISILRVSDLSFG